MMSVFLLFNFVFISLLYNWYSIGLIIIDFEFDVLDWELLFPLFPFGLGFLCLAGIIVLPCVKDWDKGTLGLIAICDKFVDDVEVFVDDVFVDDVFVDDVFVDNVFVDDVFVDDVFAVSYTHLTLPTKRIV